MNIINMIFCVPLAIIALQAIAVFIAFCVQAFIVLYSICFMPETGILRHPLLALRTCLGTRQK
jgi:hypothetical protein